MKNLTRLVGFVFLVPIAWAALVTLGIDVGIASPPLRDGFARADGRSITTFSLNSVGKLTGVEVAPDSGNIYAVLSNGGCSATQHSEVIVLSRNGVEIARVPLGSLPQQPLYNPANHMVYLMSGCNPGGITVMSGTQVLSQIDLRGNRIVVNRNTGTVYVGNNTTVFAIVNDQVVGQVDHGGYILDALAVNSENDRVYASYRYYDVGTGTYRSSIAILQGTTMFAARVGDIGYGFAIDVDESTGRAYVADNLPGRNSIAVISGTSAITLGVGLRPTGVRYDPDSGLVFVSNGLGSSISVISRTFVITTVPTVAGPTEIVADPASVYNFVRGNTKVDILKGTRSQAVVDFAGGNIYDLAYNRLTGDLYAADYTNNAIYVVSKDPVIFSLSQALLPYSEADIRLDFGQPVVADGVTFTMSPTVWITPVWTGLMRPAEQRTIASKVTLAHDPLEPGISYSLAVSGAVDLDGNLVPSQELSYTVATNRVFLPVTRR